MAILSLRFSIKDLFRFVLLVECLPGVNVCTVSQSDERKHFYSVLPCSAHFGSCNLCPVLSSSFVSSSSSSSSSSKRKRRLIDQRLLRVTGAACCVWACVFLLLFYDSPDHHPSLSEEEKMHLANYGHSVASSSKRLVSQYSF